MLFRSSAVILSPDYGSGSVKATARDRFHEHLTKGGARRLEAAGEILKPETAAAGAELMPRVFSREVLVGFPAEGFGT